MKVDLAVLAAAIQMVIMLLMGISGWVSINRQLARLTAQVEMLISPPDGVVSWTDGPRRRMSDYPAARDN